MPLTDHLDDAPLGRLVAMAGHLATQRWSRYLAEAYGLSPGGAAVLMALHSDGRLLHNEVADRCAVRAATLTGVVDTLVRSGHVERVNNEGDRRAVWVNLTAEGSAIAAQLHRRVRHRDSLTSVDADPSNEAVIRRFLIEYITRLADKEENDSGRRGPGPGQEVPEDTSQRGRSAHVRG